MPNLKINSCKECPHHIVEREHWMDDCFRIFCGHEEQTNTEGYVTKISRSGGIFFNCPLDKPEPIHCPSCGWEGNKDDIVCTDWGDEEYAFCPECNEWLL